MFKIDGKSAGKTCLQVACHQGHLDLVRLLLDNGTSLQTVDDDGDTALHYSAFGNQPEIMELLLKKGANINSVNKGRCSPLHVTVNKQHPACVKLLLKYNADVNLQDAYGDTALHDAIGKESVEILEMLGNSPHLTLTLRNKRGFNVMHHAALKGNNFAIEKLVLRARQFVDVKKEDGFASLHLAALNGHRQIAETLLNLGQADVNITNNRRQTPLLLAVSQGQCGIVELLVNHGADVNAADEDGDTAMHLALQRGSNTMSSQPPHCPTITHILGELRARGLEKNNSLSMTCYLAQKGGNITAVNGKGKTPLDLINDSATVDILQCYTEQTVQGSMARIDMDLKALDLAAESLRSSGNTEGTIKGDIVGAGTSGVKAAAAAAPALPPRASEWGGGGSGSGQASPRRITSYSQPASPAHQAAQSSNSTASSSCHQPSGVSNPGFVELTPNCGGGNGTSDATINALSNPMAVPATSNNITDESKNVLTGKPGPSTQDQMCVICLEAVANVYFDPCKHCVTCEECAGRLKKCFQCQSIILGKVTMGKLDYIIKICIYVLFLQ